MSPLSDMAQPPEDAGPPLTRIALDAPLPTFSIQAGQEQLAPDARSFSADGRVVVAGGREFLLKADHVSGDLSTGVTDASGNLYLRELGTVIAGSSMHFNLVDITGFFTRATVSQGPLTITADRITLYPHRALAYGSSFSTCPPGMKQDYHIQARTLVYDEAAERLTAIGAAIYLGRTRLAYVPYLSVPLARAGREKSFSDVVRQQFGYDRFDGAYVGVTAHLLVARLPISFSAILPQRSSIEGDAYTFIPVIRPRARKSTGANPNPIELVREFAQARAGLLPAGDPLLFHNFGVPSPFDRMLSQSGSSATLSIRPILGLRDRVFGKGDGDLDVSRLPEVNFLGYIPVAGHQDLPQTGDAEDVRQALRQIALRLSLNPQFGYYHEYPDGVHHSRQAINASLDARPLLIGPNTLFYPRLGVQSNSYSGGFSYHYYQIDMGIEHFVTDRNAFGLEYIKSKVSGASPFIFDTLDTSNELDLRGQVGNSHHIVNVLLRYDLNRHDIYSWDLTYGHVLHCLVPTISYDARSHNIGVGLNVQGFTF